MSNFGSMTDEELALLYVGGNNRAFDELLSRTQSKLFTYIMFVVRDHDTANDIFQDTFVKALSDKRRIIVVNIQKFWELKKAIEKAGKDKE